MKNNLIKYAFSLLLGVAICFFALHQCDNSVSKDFLHTQKATSAKEIKKDKDNIVRADKKAAVSDSARKEPIIKWRSGKLKIIHDTVFTRDSVLKLIQICDTIIVRDSVAISDLKEVSRLKDTLIAKQGLVMSADSSTIKGLRKENKKLKRQRNGIIALWFLRESAGVAKAVKP